MTETTTTGAAPRRGVLAVRLAAAAGLLVVVAATVVVAGPWPAETPAVAPADGSGLNPLEPGAVAARPAAGEPATKPDGVERAVGQWTQTGNTPPKPSKKKG